MEMDPRLRGDDKKLATLSRSAHLDPRSTPWREQALRGDDMIHNL